MKSAISAIGAIDEIGATAGRKKRGAASHVVGLAAVAVRMLR
jgi:hypothetical protein